MYQRKLRYENNKNEIYHRYACTFSFLNINSPVALIALKTTGEISFKENAIVTPPLNN